VTKVVISLATLGLCIGLTAESGHAAGKKNVQGSGCVEKAAENSCRVVIDSQTGVLYDLMFSGGIPKPGTAIQFKGTVHHGARSCSTGKPVAVSKWKKEKGIKCPPPVIASAMGR